MLLPYITIITESLLENLFQNAVHCFRGGMNGISFTCFKICLSTDFTKAGKIEPALVVFILPAFVYINAAALKRLAHK